MSERTLHVDLRVGEVLMIGAARVQLEQKSGQRARLSISAPPGMRVEPPARMSAVDAARRGVKDAVGG